MNEIDELDLVRTIRRANDENDALELLTGYGRMREISGEAAGLAEGAKIFNAGDLTETNNK